MKAQVVAVAATICIGSLAGCASSPPPAVNTPQATTAVAESSPSMLQGSSSTIASRCASADADCRAEATGSSALSMQEAQTTAEESADNTSNDWSLNGTCPSAEIVTQAVGIEGLLDTPPMAGRCEYFNAAFTDDIIVIAGSGALPATDPLLPAGTVPDDLSSQLGPGASAFAIDNRSTSWGHYETYTTFPVNGGYMKLDIYRENPTGQENVKLAEYILASGI